MALATVQETLNLPGAAKAKGARVYLRLLAVDDGGEALGYVEGSDLAVGGRRTIPVRGDGTWKATGIAPNVGASDDVISAPANTRYEIVVEYPDGRISDPRYIEVPDSAGPHEVQDILSAAPADLTALDATRIAFDGDSLAGVTVAAALDELDVAKDDRVHGREHTSVARQLTAGMTSARGGLRPLRGVVIGDSIFELVGGVGAWQRLHRILSADPPGEWFPPNHFVLPWDIDEGDAGGWGLDRRGTTLDVGEDAGFTVTLSAAQELVISYEAHTAGATVECRVDTALVDTKDTSDDEDGAPVADDTPAQQWVVGNIGPGTVDVLLTATGSGTARIEARLIRSGTGAEIHGTGLAGQSSATCLADGKAVAHIAAMVARDEAPDFVLLGTDTADHQATPADLVDEVVALADAVRAEAPQATIVYFIPHRHLSGATYATWDIAYAPALRAMCVDEGFLPVDGAAAIGDITTAGGNLQGFGGDQVHLSFTGLGALDDIILDALASRTVTPPAGVVGDLAAHLADTEAAHAASAVSVNPSGLAVVSTDDVQAALAELDAELELKAPQTTPVFDLTSSPDHAAFRDGGEVRVYGNTALGAMVGFYTGAGIGVGAGNLEIYGQFGVVSAGPGGSAADLTFGRLAAGVFRVANGSTAGGAVLELGNMTAPGAPGAGFARLYIDTSGGKLRLMVRFPSGAAQQVAIEP